MQMRLEPQHGSAQRTFRLSPGSKSMALSLSCACLPLLCLTWSPFSLLFIFPLTTTLREFSQTSLRPGEAEDLISAAPENW